MNRIDLSAKLREAIEVAQYDPAEAIKLLAAIVHDLNDEINELKSKK